MQAHPMPNKGARMLSWRLRKRCKIVLDKRPPLSASAISAQPQVSGQVPSSTQSPNHWRAHTSWQVLKTLAGTGKDSLQL